ncbi:MAG: SDR family NAD(P)-dependent oxidoreductase [Robiginitomaculum sp.]|nr:SDR family NAD(P)-dependent oxidoreductase [Robiginitomaculum sp.]
MNFEQRIALTGATGFLGSHVAKVLMAKGFTLNALVRNPKRAEHLQVRGIKLVAGDLSDAKSLQELVSNCSCVVHIAGAIKAKSSKQLFQINGGGTANLVKACAVNNPQIRFVHISSVAAREPQLSDYANSKFASETEAKKHNGAVAIVRPNAVYGPNDRETLQIFQVASGLFHPVLVGKESRIAMIHVADAAKAITALCSVDAPTGLFEISDARADGYSWREISQTAVSSVGGKYRPIKIPKWLFHTCGFVSENIGKLRDQPTILNSGKVREILHGDWSVQDDLQIPAEIWKAKIDLESGFRDTVQWYRQQGWLK